MPGLSSASPPTLCLNQEKTYLTGLLSLQYVSSGAKEPKGAEISAMSLCLDGTGRIPSLVLRIGRRSASDTFVRSGRNKRFYTFTAEDGPHLGRDVIAVRDGPTLYCVSAPIAQSHGVGLEISVDGQWPPTWYHSGIEAGVTYYVTDDEVLRKSVRSLLRQGNRSLCT